MPLPDKNFFNISGDDAGNIWVNDVLTFTADQPGMREINIGSVQPPLGPNGEIIWADALKISGIRRLRVIVDVLDGRACREDAIDINHSEDVEVEINILYPGRTFCGTIKGESKRCTVEVGVQIGHAKEVDWDYGNHENTRNGYTTSQTLVVNTEDRSLATARCLQADPLASVQPSSYKYIFPNPYKWYHGIVIFFFRIFIR